MFVISCYFCDVLCCYYFFAFVALSLRALVFLSIVELSIICLLSQYVICLICFYGFVNLCCFTFIFRSLFRSHGQKTIVCHTALAVPEGKSHDNSGYMKLSLFSDLMSSITHRFEQCDDLEAFKNEKTTIANLKKPMADLLAAAKTSSGELKRAADQRKEKQRQISERCAREREREGEEVQQDK